MKPKTRNGFTGLGLIGLLLLLYALLGCATTVTPPVAASHVASWDGTNQNSGFVGFLPDGSGLITPHARDRYNGLVAIYGARFVPPLALDGGITPAPGGYRIDPQHLRYFATMNRWRKQPKIP